MYMTLTPLSNIDWEKNEVINNQKVFETKKNWDDIITVRNLRTSEIEETTVSRVSLFDHILLYDGSEHVILFGLSKNN